MGFFLIYANHCLHLLDVDFLYVLLAGGPFTLLNANYTTKDLNQTLEQQNKTR
jgi:hypothetical protein